MKYLLMENPRMDRNDGIAQSQMVAQGFCNGHMTCNPNISDAAALLERFPRQLFQVPPQRKSHADIRAYSKRKSGV
jgi:hypothetical protein